MTALALIVAYAIGCVATGYYLVREIAGDDLRRHATGSTGARNVGRRVGLPAAVATLAADVGKGAAAVAIAAAIAGWTAAAAGLPAVVLGHVAPVQLRFRGGRGLGPAVGGLAVLDWRVALAGLAVAAVCAAATRALTASGLAGAAAAAPAALLAGDRAVTVAACVAATAVIFAAHARPRPEGRD
jgi:acyl phosphate:glycerol-3-phosphate acyltransferase